MIKKIFTNLRDKIFGIEKLEYKLKSEIKSEQSYYYKELKAIEVLRPYFPKGYLFETGYTLSFHVVQHIINDIIINKPKSVLEIGSGLSTILISNFLKEFNSDIEFISIDHDREWQRQLQNHCQYVEFLSFEISSYNCYSFQGTGSWYNIPNNINVLNKRFDLVIVDGPTGIEGKYARYGVVEFLKNRLNDSSIIFLDDTFREDELFISDCIKNSFHFNYVDHYSTYRRFSNDNLRFSSPSYFVH